MRGSFTEWRRDAREWLRVHRSEIWILTAIWIVISLVMFWLAKGHVSPRRAQDEFLFWGVAKSFAEGNGLTWRGQDIGLYSALYPILLAPAFWIAEDVQGRYTIVHLLSSTMMSAAIFPGFFLARMMVDRWRALIVALMTVSVPAMNYAGVVGTETLAYPAFTAACGAIVLALARPRLRHAVSAFTFIFLAAFVRTQFVILLPVFAGALLLATLMRPRGTRLRYLSDREPVWMGLLAIGLPAGVYILARGSSAFGLYSGFFAAGVPFDWSEAWFWIKAFTADVYLLSAIVPAIATFGMLGRAENRRDPVIGAMLALTLVASLALIAQVSWFSATNEFNWRAKHIFYERYMFYLGPLYFAGFLAAFGRATWRAALGSTFVATLIVTGFQTEAVLVPISYDSFGLSLVGVYMKYHPGPALHVGMLLAGLTLVLGLIYSGSLLGGSFSRKLAGLLVAFTLVLLLVTQGMTWHIVRQASVKSISAFPSPVDFIAQTTDQPVGMIVTRDSSAALYFTEEFWNPNLVRFFATDANPILTPKMYSPRCRFELSATGRIVSPDCDLIPNAWFVRSRILVMHLQDEYKRVHPSAKWPSYTLMEAKPPARVLSFVYGRNVRSGNVFGGLNVGVFSGVKGSIRVRLRAGGRPVVLRSQDRSWRLRPGERLSVFEDLDPPGSSFSLEIKTPTEKGGAVVVTGVEMRKGEGPWRSLL